MSRLRVAYVLDKDGTLVDQDTPVHGAAEFLSNLSAPYVLLTNTGVKTAEDVAAEMSETLGVRVPANQVLTAHDAMQRAVRDRSDQGSIFVVRDKHEDCQPPIEPCTCVAVFSDGLLDDFCRTVSTVADLLSHGAELWTTSVDATVRELREDGTVRYRTGPGVFCDAVATVLGRRPPRMRVFGKGGTEDTHLGNIVMDMLRTQGFDGDRQWVTMVGDRWDTDMRIGVRNGWQTCLVESGCHSLEDAPLFCMADVVAANVYELLDDTVKRNREERGWHGTLWHTTQEVTRRVLCDVIRSDTSREVSRWLTAKVSRIVTAPPRRVHSAPDLARLGAHSSTT